MKLPYLTASLPGIGGLIKQHAEDFRVDEVPLYAHDGTGTHGYVRIEKRNLSTMECARLIAKALGKKTMEIGYAGLKDTRAVTTQWFSVEHTESARLKALEIPHAKVVQVSRHRNKIKMGHLAGNRFIIKVRNPEWTRVGASLDEPEAKADAIIKQLETTGVPNFFGPQRFGMRKDNHLLGLALIRGHDEEFIKRFLGDPDETVDHGGVLVARQVFAKGKHADALTYWPGHLAQERRALMALINSKGNAHRAVGSIDIKLKQLLVSALQSFLFNEVLTRRLKKLDKVLPGDLMWKHDNGSVFAIGEEIDAAQKEQPRADAHEISPSGPLFGYKMTQTQSLVKMMEDRVLTDNELSLEAFRGPSGTHGGRRAMRFFPKDLELATGTDERGPFLEFAFTLPSGSYATVLLGEIMKEDVVVD